MFAFNPATLVERAPTELVPRLFVNIQLAIAVPASFVPQKTYAVVTNPPVELR